MKHARGVKWLHRIFPKNNCDNWTPFSFQIPEMTDEEAEF